VQFEGYSLKNWTLIATLARESSLWNHIIHTMNLSLSSLVRSFEMLQRWQDRTTVKFDVHLSYARARNGETLMASSLLAGDLFHGRCDRTIRFITSKQYNSGGSYWLQYQRLPSIEIISPEERENFIVRFKRIPLPHTHQQCLHHIFWRGRFWKFSSKGCLSLSNQSMT